MYTYKSEDWMTGSLPFSISRGAFKAGHVVEIHKHEFIELVYIADGKTTHYIDSVAYDAMAGDIVFVNYGQTHSFQVNEDVEYYNLFVKPEYISEKLADAETIYDVFSFFIIGNYFENSDSRLSLTRLSPALRAEMERFVQAMHDEVQLRKAGFELALDGYMRLVFSRIIRSLRESEQKKVYSAITPEILEFIDANYTKNLTLSELANKCFYNSAYLGRIFKTTFNISLREYINEKRVEYARTLLETTDETIENISSLVGYSDKKQFYRVFREKTGCTPGQYRDKTK